MTSEGMLYPEILDLKEYRVSLGKTASIDRQKREAVSIDNTFCTCSRTIDDQLLREINHVLSKIQEDYDFDNNYYTRNIKKNHNHARNIRKAVMYKEMFDLPVMQGTKGIDKEMLERAYTSHRYYRASWNKNNKERLKTHKKSNAKRKAEGRYQYAYDSTGFNSREFRDEALFCDDICIQQLTSWLLQEDVPQQQMGQLLSLGTLGDVTILQSFLRCIDRALYTLYDGELTSANTVESNYAYIKKLFDKNPKSRWTPIQAKQYANLMLKDEVDISLLCFNNPMYIYDNVISLLQSFGGMTVEELERRLDNIRSVLDLVYTYVRNTVPQQAVGMQTLTKYRKEVKHLAMLYQAMCTGSSKIVARRVTPKSVANDKSNNFELKHYTQEKSTADNLQSQVDYMMKQGGLPSKTNNRKIRWANTVFIKGKLVKNLQSTLKARRDRPSEVGAVPKYINRWATDKYIWASKRKATRGGTIAIDCSGSMSFSSEDIYEVIKSLPASKIVGYAGRSTYERDDEELPEGVIETFAEDQRMISDYYETFIKKNGYGQNYVDVPAIMWLSRQPKPRMLVTDMEVVALDATRKGSHVYTEELIEMCEQLCIKHDIIVIADVNEAIEYAKHISNR